jgi:adenosine deaminase
VLPHREGIATIPPQPCYGPDSVTKEPIPDPFLAAVPKTDLHVHLDGSIRVGTLVDLAKEYGVQLPSYTEAGLRELVFKDRYENLAEYLTGFKYTVGVLQTELALERGAYELAVDNQNEGVRYIEVRFAPQLHVHKHMNIVMAIKAVNRGLKRAQREFNARESVLEGREPGFHYGIIVCAMRMFRENFSEYYGNLMRAHRYSPAKAVYQLASLELARAAIIARDEYGLPVVGFDLAGEEAGYPADEHRAAFAYCHKHFLKKTVHAGEAYGPESIFQAITDLYADRLGHGTYLLEPDAIKDEEIEDRERYVQRLGQYIADRRITLEVCLTSNLQTNPHMRNPSDHTLSKMRVHRLSTTICTDNRTISNTTVTNELKLATEILGLSRNSLKSIIIYGFKRSFFPGDYLMKRKYVRETIDYYESIEREFFGAESSVG